MTNTRHGEFKLAKQTGRTARFARIGVEIRVSNADEGEIMAPDSVIRIVVPSILTLPTGGSFRAG